MSSVIVKYAVSLTGGDGIPAWTSRSVVRPGEVDTTLVSLSMFKGDDSDHRAVAEHVKKVLEISVGYDVAVLSVSRPE